MNTLTPRLLLVDDDADLCQLLAEYLEGEGFAVAMATDGEQALAQLRSPPPPALMVLDIMMPGISGLEVLQQMRQFSNVPVIMLTGRGDDIDRIIGLEMGADDYLAKPCNPRELSARIKAILRRSQTTAASSADTALSGLHLPGLHLDASALNASIDGTPLNLTGAEFRTLQYLADNAGQLLSKEQLTEQVLQRKLSRYDRSMDVHISRIRQKLQSAQARLSIKSVRGFGYQLIVDGEPD